MHRLVFFVLFIALPCAAVAAPMSARTAFEELHRCVQTMPAADCREMVTAGSVAMYDRFMGYGLTRCIPKDVRFVSEQRSGEYILVRAGTSKDSGPARGIRVAFVNEEERMKLDAPESLRLWLGEDWRDRIDFAEQLYVAMRAQFGNNVNCDTARALIK